MGCRIMNDNPKRATMDELLEFANAVREAGGGNPIDALMPAIPEDPTSCLIARNLNFNCVVNAQDGAWYMAVPDAALRDRIADALGLAKDDATGFDYCPDDGEYEYLRCSVVLPPGIGQLAADFDEASMIAHRLVDYAADYSPEGVREAIREYGDPDEIRLLEEMWPYIEESIREAHELGVITEDGKLVL